MPQLYTDRFVNIPNEVTLKFRFQSAGASTTAPDFIMPHLSGVTSVTQSSSGVFVVTLAEKYPVFVGGFGRVIPATTAVTDQDVRIALDGYVPSTGVLTLTVIGALDTTVTAEAVTANDWVYLELTFCRNSQQAPTGAI